MFGRTTPARLASWVMVITYAAVVGGGGWLFYRYVLDEEWRGLFLTIWWLPAGVLALWLRNRLEDYLCARASRQQLQSH